MHMLGIFGTSHKDDTDKKDTEEALKDAAEALGDATTDSPGGDSTPASPAAALFTDEPEKTPDLQAQYRHLREETSELLQEEHPDITRRDTVEEAHKRGEL